MSSSCTRGCRIAAVLAVLSLTSVFAQNASASTIYTQTFDYSTTTVDEPLGAVGWFAYLADECYDNSTFAANGTAVTAAIGSGSVPGVAYTIPGNYAGYESLLGTSSGFTAINQSQYSSLTFSWSQWTGNTTMKGQLAVDIAGTWYASKDAFSNSTAWTYSNGVLGNDESKSLSLASASGWYALTVTPGTTLSLGTTEVSLPTAGNIVAAGLYCTDTTFGNNSFVLDNFQVSGVPTPEPGTLALLIGAMLSLVAYAWSKRK